MTECQGPSGPYTLPGNEPCPQGYNPGLITPGGYLSGQALNAPGQIPATTASGYSAAAQNALGSLIPSNLTDWLGNSSNWKHLGLLLAGAVLIILGAQFFMGASVAETPEGKEAVSTITGT